MQRRGGIPDSVLMYASVFTYNKQLRLDVLNTNINWDQVASYEQNGFINKGAGQNLSAFIGFNEKQQREFLGNKQKAEELFCTLFSIIEKIKGQKELTTYALCLINGIIEDKRTRIRNLVAIQKSKNEEKQKDLIGILNSFIIQNSEKENIQRDLAAHTLSMLIEAVEYENCRDEARQFLNYMLQQRDDKDRKVSDTCYTTCLMYLLKANELAREFVDQRGFEIMQKFLQNQAITDGQIAYNVICALWIISYHHFALKGFEDFTLMIIELVSKILNYFNKEKIVRVICMLFDNLKDSTVCLEHLSMINALNIIIKLQNRPWVDKDIENRLQKLFVFFDSNYKEFSSFDKWRRQVQQRQLCWSPVHTEKFW